MKKSNFKMTSVIFGQLVAGCLAASQSFAFVAPEEPAGVEFKHATVRPQTYRPLNSFFSRDGVHREYDKHSNAIRYLSGSKILGVQVTGTAKAAYEKVALETIVAHKPIFGVEASEVRVNQKATLVSGQDASVSFQVLRGGIRIVDAGITFHFKNGSLILVKSESYSEATPQLGSGADTVAIAAGAVGGGIPIARGSLFRVQATDAGYSLVRVNEYLVSDGSEAYIVQVDASSGAIFELRTKNLHLRGTAAAKVYPRYFGDVMVSTRLPFVNLDLATSHSSASGEFSSANSTEAPSLNGFAGKFATVKNQAADDLKATAVKANGIWELNIAVETNIETPWENQDMAQAMVYLNTTKMVSTAKNFINPDWFDTSLVANVNHAEHCNAYWDGETINFFTGGEYKGKTCANTGTVSDVVFHEWGHGLDDNTGGIDDSALSEGYGDALALYMTGDPKIGVDFFPIEHKPVRNLSIVKVFPTDVVKDPHKTGLIVAGAWYDLYVALIAKLGDSDAKDVMGKFLFKGIYEFAKMSDVYRATVALDDDNGNLADGTPNLCLINKAFMTHGLAEADPICAR